MTTVRKIEFARMINRSPSWVTVQAQRGVIVLDAQGRVLVEESQRRIKSMKDPNRDDVRRRHAAQRARLPVETMPVDELSTVGDPASVFDHDSFADARRRREIANAEIAEMERDKMRGTLLHATEVRQVLAQAGTLVRQALESVPDRLAPELSGLSDQSVIYARLVEEMEAVLVQLHGCLKNYVAPV